MSVKILKKDEVLQGEANMFIDDESVSSEVLDYPTEATHKSRDLCEVKFDIGRTINLGNYESVRVGVSIKLPCYPQEVDAVFKYSRSWATTKLGEVISEATDL